MLNYATAWVFIFLHLDYCYDECVDLMLSVLDKGELHLIRGLYKFFFLQKCNVYIFW